VHVIWSTDVPEDIHRTLKARAAKEGLSLSEYLLREAVDVAERPTMAQMIERIRSRPQVRTNFSSAEIIRAEREERDRGRVDRH
jgi:predicted RND superfamily exporter protein